MFWFPQSDYQDGTFIDKEGDYRRLTDYSIAPLGFTEAGGHKFSFIARGGGEAFQAIGYTDK